jgi:RNA polymerase sigma factor (sigma-70 family)
MKTKRQIEWDKVEYARIQNNKRIYERASKKALEPKKELPYKDIVPTEEELEILYQAVGIYVKSANKGRTGYPITFGDTLGDGYEGMIKTLYTFKPEYCKNKKAYLITKIRYHLLDCYRSRYGRNGQKLSEFNTDSLDREINCKDDGTVSMLEILISNNPSCEELLENEDTFEYIEKFFSRIPIESWGISGDDIFAMLMLRYEGYSVREIAETSVIDEKVIHQIMLQTVQPFLRHLSEKFTGEVLGKIPMK